MPNATSALMSRERSSIRWSINGALVLSMSSWVMNERPLHGSCPLQAKAAGRAQPAARVRRRQLPLHRLRGRQARGANFPRSSSVRLRPETPPHPPPYPPPHDPPPHVGAGTEER